MIEVESAKIVNSTHPMREEDQCAAGKAAFRNACLKGRAGEVVRLGLSCVVGRDATATVKVDSPRVADFHVAVIRCGPGLWKLMDLATSLGTRLNSRRIVGTVALCDGDVIQIGPCEHRFESEPSPTADRYEFSQDDWDAETAWVLGASGVVNPMEVDMVGQIKSMHPDTRIAFTQFFPGFGGGELPSAVADWMWKVRLNVARPFIRKQRREILMISIVEDTVSPDSQILSVIHGTNGPDVAHAFPLTQTESYVVDFVLREFPGDFSEKKFANEGRLVSVSLALIRAKFDVLRVAELRQHSVASLLGYKPRPPNRKM